jgi:hypothetical protein
MSLFGYQFGFSSSANQSSLPPGPAVQLIVDDLDDTAGLAKTGTPFVPQQQIIALNDFGSLGELKISGYTDQGVTFLPAVLTLAIENSSTTDSFTLNTEELTVKQAGGDTTTILLAAPIVLAPKTAPTSDEIDLYVDTLGRVYVAFYRVGDVDIIPFRGWAAAVADGPR